MPAVWSEIKVRYKIHIPPKIATVKYRVFVGPPNSARPKYDNFLLMNIRAAAITAAIENSNTLNSNPSEEILKTLPCNTTNFVIEFMLRFFDINTLTYPLVMIQRRNEPRNSDSD